VLTRRGWLQSFALRPASPNVLVFMTDQESALLPGPANLPNRARLLRRALHFRNAFCTTPQCSAARSSLLTGLYPHHTGVRTNIDAQSLGQTLSPDLPTVGHVFRQAGYSTGYFGKWHLSRQEKDLRPYGFDHRGPVKDAEATTAATAWLREQKGPFLAWVSLLNPHEIYSVRQEMAHTALRPSVRAPLSTRPTGKPAEQQEYIDRDQGKITADFTPEQWRLYRSFYLDLLEKTDAQLGRVLDAIDLDNTIVLYTSDHGDQLGEHGLPFKGPFLYEESLRVPLLLSAPGHHRPGFRDDLVNSADLAPTLAAAAGLRWPAKIDGQSILQPINRKILFAECYAKQKWVNPIRTARTHRHKLSIYDQSGHREFYDLRRDPHEQHNLAAAAPPIMADLERQLNAWRPAQL
jgi:arylsulfatase A-like enzyme